MASGRNAKMYDVMCTITPPRTHTVSNRNSHSRRYFVSVYIHFAQNAQRRSRRNICRTFSISISTAALHVCGKSLFVGIVVEFDWVVDAGRDFSDLLSRWCMCNVHQLYLFVRFGKLIMRCGETATECRPFAVPVEALSLISHYSIRLLLLCTDAGICVALTRNWLIQMECEMRVDDEPASSNWNGENAQTADVAWALAKLVVYCISPIAVAANRLDTFACDRKIEPMVRPNHSLDSKKPNRNGCVLWFFGLFANASLISICLINSPPRRTCVNW